MRNIEQRINEFNPEGNQKNEDVDMRWEQLKENGYSKNDR